MTNSQASLQQLYDSIWQKAHKALNNGGPHIDPYLNKIHEDRRLGMTLIARPGPLITQQALDIQKRLHQIEPQQHYYKADELHMTILTLFNVMDDYEPHMAKAPHYATSLAAALADMSPFQVNFQGICASPEAVMLQGFPEDSHLEDLRETLREHLRIHGLGETLDVRYRISTAHSTIMRFSRPLQNAPALLELLSHLRKQPFGDVTCRSVQWVQNDWYMSSDKVKLLTEYQLKQQPGGTDA